MNESIVDLGHGRFGVLHGSQDPAAVMLVLLSAGAVHRQGPFRLYVQLARRMAAIGFRSFRFDQPGIGDSLQAAERPQREIVGEVLDRLQAQTGCARFIVGGICSAADAAWQLALTDPRVCGLLLLDPVAYSPRWFRFGRLLRLRSPASILAALKRRLAGFATRAPRGQLAVESDYRDWPKPSEAGPQLTILCARGVEVFALYTGGVANYFLHPRQFADTFGNAAADPHVQFQYWPDVDHLFYRPADRARLIDQLCTWTQSRFARP
jgi:pimeloyl-ACP methyl ester carboxylesterase